jgi:hypothetical protein
MISITWMARCPPPDQRKIYRPVAIYIAKGNLSSQNAKTISRPFIAGSTHHGHQVTGGNNTKRLLLFLLSVTNFHHFPENSLLFENPRRRRPRRRGTNAMRTMTLRAITSAMRELHSDEGKSVHRLSDGI